MDDSKGIQTPHYALECYFLRAFTFAHRAFCARLIFLRADADKMLRRL